MNFGSIQNKLTEVLEPIAVKVGENKTLTAITEGFVRTSPITLGIAIFTIIGNFPIQSWLDLLERSGLNEHFAALIGASTNILALYVTFSIAFSYAKNNGQNGMTSGFLALASFFVLMPQTINVGEESISALSTQYLGGDGLFVGLIVAIVVAKLCTWLTDKGMVFKMPKSVPPMVSESLSPAFISTIILGLIFAVRIGVSYTSFGTVFEIVNKLISGPIVALGTSVPAVILLITLTNFVWFFGLHPNTIYAPMTPLLMSMLIGNMQAFQAGTPQPFAMSSLVLFCCGIGGTGTTLGLCISMLSAKSKRYKQMLKLGGIPNIFNINEPIIFGFPLMLNPTLFVPFVFSTPIMGIVAYLLLKIIPISYVPASALLPFTTPFFVKGFIGGGIGLVAILLVCLVVNTLIWLPFFKIVDKKALEEELIAEKETN